MTFTILPIRLIGCILVTIIGFFTISLDIKIQRLRPAHKEKHTNKHLQLIARAYVFCIGFRVKILDKRDLESTETIQHTIPGSLANVCNHSSYLDPLLLTALGCRGFASKSAVANIPIFGLYTKTLDGFFIARGDKMARKVAALEISSRVSGKSRDANGAAKPLTVFPEGTTGNGTSMYTFRDSLFREAEPVQPYCIKYEFKKFNPAWESINIIYHIWRILTSVYTSVTISILPTYVPSEFEKAQPKVYADNVRREIAKEGGFTLNTRSVVEKLTFTQWLHKRDHSVYEMLKRVEIEHKKTLEDLELLEIIRNGEK